MALLSLPGPVCGACNRHTDEDSGSFSGWIPKPGMKCMSFDLLQEEYTQPSSVHKHFAKSNLGKSCTPDHDLKEVTQL